MSEFTVLISVYKNEKPEFLYQSLCSVLVDQTLRPHEVVVIKDGNLSRELDKVLQIYQLMYPYILKVYGYSVNRGLGYSLNFGLKLASNELVFRMDTDDIAIPERFEKQIEAFNDNSNPAIVGSNIEEFHIHPKDYQLIRFVPHNFEQIHKSKWRRNPFNHMTVGFKKSIILSCGGYKTMTGYEDYYLWLRVLKNNNGCNLPDNLVHARIGNGMIARRHGWPFLINEFKFQYTILSEGFLTFPQFLNNIFTRVLPRIFPQWLLQGIYTNFLRSNSKRSLSNNI